MTSRRTVFRADDARGSVHITSTAPQISEHDDLERYGVMCLAHHEAGHAVAALNAGARVLRIRIWRDGGDYVGETTMQWPDETPRWFRAAAEAALAGTPAEQRWIDEQPHLRRPRTLTHSADDEGSALEHLSRIRSGAPRLSAVERSASRIIARRWSSVQSIAERLWIARDLSNVRL